MLLAARYHSYLLRIMPCIFTAGYVFAGEFQEPKDLTKAVESLNAVQKVLDNNAVNSCSIVPYPRRNLSPSNPSCAETASSVTADDSPSKAYFETILKRGMDTPIQDFLKLWYPRRASAKIEEKDPYFFSCEKSPWASLNWAADDSLAPDCRPDVLYSWGPPVKIKNMLVAMPDGKSWQGSPNPGYSMATAISPASSFSYGLDQIRIKLKKTAEFNRNPVLKNKAVIFSSVVNEFDIADSNMIESWSYGTPEQYDEIVRDILRVTSGKRAILLNSQAPPDLKASDPHSGLHRLFRGNGTETEGWDGHPGTELELKVALLNHIKMILNGEGRIIYSKEACRNRRFYFQTDKPSYFNPLVQTHD